MEVDEMLKNFLLATLFCLAFGVVINAQVVANQPVAKNNLPDLVVKEILFESSLNEIRVRVLNQGNTASSNCYVGLFSMMGENAALGTKRAWTIEIPALQPGKGYSRKILVSPLTHANGPWKAVVDRSNQIKESNESNNELVQYAVGGVLSAPAPDLLITRAVLIDATNGEVSVEVKNIEGVAAGSSQLRLIVWEMGKFEQKSAKEVFVKVPQIGPNASINVKVKAGVPIISTKYSLYIDIGEQVTEKNENNNRYEGEAGKS